MGNTFEMDNSTGGDSGDILTLDDLLLYLGVSGVATTFETQIATAALKAARSAVQRYLRYNPVQSVATEYYPMGDLTNRGQSVVEANDTQAYVREVSSNHGSELQLMRIPVRSLDQEGNNPIEIRVDYDGRSGTRPGSFGSDTVKIEGLDFHPNYDLVDSLGEKVCRDGLIRSYGLWPSAPGSVKVTYVAGYSVVEFSGDDPILDASMIREAVVDEAVRRVHKTYSRMKGRSGFGVGPKSSEHLGDYSYTSDPTLIKQLLGSSSDILPETALKLEEFVNYGGMLFL